MASDASTDQRAVASDDAATHIHRSASTSPVTALGSVANPRRIRL